VLHPCYLKQGNPEPGATHKTDQSSDQLAVPAFSFQSHDYPEHRCAIRPGDQHLSARNRKLFANRVLSVANATALIVSFAIIGTVFFIAQYFLEVQGYTVLEEWLKLSREAMEFVASKR
jgi:hypothetical protein